MSLYRHFRRCLAVGLIGLTAAISLGGCQPSPPPSDEPPENTAPLPALSPRVMAVLQKETKRIETLAADPKIVEAVKQANQADQDVTMEEIQLRDKQWQQTEGLDDFSKSFITNPYGQFLMDFQEVYDGFPEIFVTDRRGLIVAATNKTTDYYQADESWWVETIDGGRGKSHQGQVEYDESAFSEAIALYVPVRDPETKQAIGAIKAVCDITAIKMEL